MKFILFFVFTLVLTIGGNTQELTKFDLQWGVRVPMRDGIKLNATLYLPDNQKESLPVILDVTPYISDTYHERGRYFSQNGYVYAIIDARGRGSSEGDFDPFMQEANDGYDLVEWFAKQSFCNGKIAMWGGSYSGHNQWATAKTLPPHLSTIVPVASVYPGIDFPNGGNIFTSYTINWLTYTSSKTGNRNLFEDGTYWRTKYVELYKNQLPFSQLDKMAGNETTKFQTWISHPSFDSYWKSMSPQQEHLEKMNFPILTITGHYDGDQLGAMTHYKNFMKYASPEAKEKKYLIIGPWDHPGTRTPQAQVGGLTFGKASLLDMNKLHKEWYDFTMKGGPKPEILKKRVAYYVVGAEKWKYVDNLENIASEERSYFLSSSGSANVVFQSGQLVSSPPEKSAPDKISYDPMNIAPGRVTGDGNVPYLKNQYEAMNLDDGGVIYHTEPFRDTTEVTGFIKAKLFISSTVPDVDLHVSIYEITPEGESISLTQQSLRLRYHASLEQEKLLQPNQVYECNFENLRFFSRQISKGSRLRFIVAAVNSPYLEKNYCSGGVVANETAKDARKAVLTIHHDKKYPSKIVVPIVR